MNKSFVIINLVLITKAVTLKVRGILGVNYCL